VVVQGHEHRFSCDRLHFCHLDLHRSDGASALYG
jgi:hypothetical protein